jgi:hypothetical protein
MHTTHQIAPTPEQHSDPDTEQGSQPATKQGSQLAGPTCQRPASCGSHTWMCFLQSPVASRPALTRLQSTAKPSLECACVCSGFTCSRCRCSSSSFEQPAAEILTSCTCTFSGRLTAAYYFCRALCAPCVPLWCEPVCCTASSVTSNET